MVHYSLPMKLRVLRAERGLTMQEAEEVTGVARETIGELERGLRNPHDVTLSKLAAGYGIPVGELLELAGKGIAPQDPGRPELFDIAQEVLYERLSRGDFEQYTRDLSREDLLGEYMDLMHRYLLERKEDA
jgi:transcriptional regulator with XRE-family HTH domain